VPEHGVIDNRDVEDGEDGDESKHNREEQELVPPNVDRPLRKVLIRVGLHHEERAAHVQHLPCKEEREPCQAGESRGTSAEHGVASIVVPFVAVVAEITVAKTEHDNGEGCETKGGDPQAVYEHIDHDFNGENTAFKLRSISPCSRGESL